MPVVFNPTITQAGQAAAINADANGLEVAITHVAFGTGAYNPNGAETALSNEVKRVSIPAGTMVTPTQARIMAIWSDPTEASAINEIGFFAGSTLFAVWSRLSGGPIGYKTAGVDFVLFNDLKFTGIPADSITIQVEDAGDSAALVALLNHEAAANPHSQYELIVDGQKSASITSIATGTADAIVGEYTPDIADLSDGMTLFVRAVAANATATPTFTPNSGTIAPKTIAKLANSALVAGDIAGAGHWLELHYDETLDKWVLQNPGVNGLLAASDAETAAGLLSSKAVTPAALLSLFSGSNQSLSGNGYQKLPGGLIVQWGTGTLPNSGTTSGSQSITWPVNFPNACLHASAIAVGNVNSVSGYIPKMQSTSVNTSGATFTGESGNGSIVFNQTCPYLWFSIGK